MKTITVKYLDQDITVNDSEIAKEIHLQAITNIVYAMEKEMPLVYSLIKKYPEENLVDLIKIVANNCKWNLRVCRDIVYIIKGKRIPEYNYTHIPGPGS